LVEGGKIIAGTPKQVTEQLEAVARDLNVGHLMLLCQIGSVPHDLAMENIRRVATEVLPNLRGVLCEWEDKWWPQALPAGRRIEQRPMFALEREATPVGDYRRGSPCGNQPVIPGPSAASGRASTGSARADEKRS